MSFPLSCRENSGKLSQNIKNSNKTCFGNLFLSCFNKFIGRDRTYNNAMGQPFLAPRPGRLFVDQKVRTHCSPRGRWAQPLSRPGMSRQFVLRRPTPLPRSPPHRILLPSPQPTPARPPPNTRALQEAHWCGVPHPFQKRQPVEHLWTEVLPRIPGVPLPLLFQAVFPEPDRLLCSFLGNSRLAPVTGAPRPGSVCKSVLTLGCPKKISSSRKCFHNKRRLRCTSKGFGICTIK